MTLVKRTNGNLDSMINNLMGGDFFMNQNRMYYGNKTLPAVNIIENDEAYLIEMAIVGFNKEDFKIELDNGKLTISADDKLTDENLNYAQREFNYGGFSRTFAVPKQKVDDVAITATYESGVLKIALPKREEVKPKPPRLVEVV